MLQPATPVPTTVKSRARARVAELHELHGWGKDSPISISKPKSNSKERQREAGAKRMRNMGFYEVADKHGYSTAKELDEELEHRKTTAPGLAEIQKKEQEMKQEQARRSKKFWDDMAMVNETKQNYEMAAERAGKRNEATTQRLAKKEAEMEVKVRKEIEAEVEVEGAAVDAERVECGNAALDDRDRLPNEAD